MENKIVTARELLLLCALRKKEVYAENLEEYSWTWNHAMFCFKQTGEMFDIKNPPTEHKHAIALAKKSFITKKPETRKFVESSSCGGACLLEGNNFPWYQEQTETDHDTNLWVYQGTFSLVIPMKDSELEEIRPKSA